MTHVSILTLRGPGLLRSPALSSSFLAGMDDKAASCCPQNRQPSYSSSQPDQTRKRGSNSPIQPLTSLESRNQKVAPLIPSFTHLLRLTWSFKIYFYKVKWLVFFIWISKPIRKQFLSSFPKLQMRLKIFHLNGTHDRLLIGCRYVYEEAFSRHPGTSASQEPRWTRCRNRRPQGMIPKIISYTATKSNPRRRLKF